MVRGAIGYAPNSNIGPITTCIYTVTQEACCMLFDSDLVLYEVRDNQ